MNFECYNLITLGQFDYKKEKGSKKHETKKKND